VLSSSTANWADATYPLPSCGLAPILLPTAAGQSGPHLGSCQALGSFALSHRGFHSCPRSSPLIGVQPCRMTALHIHSI
jgi:hypothetical protein